VASPAAPAEEATLLERSLVKVEVGLGVEDRVATEKRDAAGVFAEINAQAARGEESADSVL